MHRLHRRRDRDHQHLVYHQDHRSLELRLEHQHQLDEVRLFLAVFLFQQDEVPLV
jgi:hypothetical protein